MTDDTEVQNTGVALEEAIETHDDIIAAFTKSRNVLVAAFCSFQYQDLDTCEKRAKEAFDVVASTEDDIAAAVDLLAALGKVPLEDDEVEAEAITTELEGLEEAEDGKDSE